MRHFLYLVYWCASKLSYNIHRKENVTHIHANLCLGKCLQHVHLVFLDSAVTRATDMQLRCTGDLAHGFYVVTSNHEAWRKHLVKKLLNNTITSTTITTTTTRVFFQKFYLFLPCHITKIEKQPKEDLKT